MPRVLPLDHFCPWREEAEELKERLTSLEAKMATLERHVFGRRAERLPTVASELRGDEDKDAARTEAAQKKRQQRAARKAEQAPSREIRHAVPAESATARRAGAKT